MPQYKLSLDEQANQLDAQAEKTLNQGQEANQQRDDYVLNAVFLLLRSLRLQSWNALRGILSERWS